MHLKNEFSVDIENEFLNSKELITPLYIRGIFVMFIIIYGLFFLVDLYYFAELINLLILIRFGVVIPILISTVILTFTNRFYQLSQQMIALSFFVGGSGVAYMLVLKPENVIYIGGLFIVIFSGYLLVRLRFIYATIAGTCVILFYMIGYLLEVKELTSTFSFSSIFFIGANLIGMVGSYNFEISNRKQFLNNKKLTDINNMLKQQYEEKKEQFNVLENSIKENKILQEINLEKDKITQSLIESEEQYRLLTTEMQLGLALHEIICDNNGKPVNYKFISVNESYERLTGLKKEVVVGKTLLDVLPNIETYWIETFGEVALTGKSIQYENYVAEIKKYFGTSVYSPKKGQFAVIVEDITDRILLENKRKQEQKDLLTSQKIAKLGTWRLDIKTNEVVWSEELYKMYGFDPSVPPPPYTEHMKLFTRPSWEKLSTALEITSTKGIPYELELETITIDGSRGWMWVRGEAEFDEEGNISSLAGAAQDITERKLLQQELSETDQIISTILEKSPVAIEFYDTKGNHTYSNDTAISLFGVTNPKELKNSNLLKNPNLSNDLLTRLSNMETIDIELEYDFEKVKLNKVYQTNKLGTIMLDLTITPINTNNEFSGYIVHSKDITEELRKKKEIEYISYHDYLTNLYNRRYFVEAFNKLVSQESFPIGLMMIDINGLKIINDAYGHAQGDLTIKLVSNVLMKIFGKDDVVARIGGDEFAIISPRKNHKDMLASKDKIIELSKKVTVGNIEISLAIGYEILLDSKKDLDEILNRAEKVLYQHKITVGSSVRNHAIKAILSTLQEKYKEEKTHSERVSENCRQIGIALKLSKEEIDILELAGMYHDIGKISLPDAILYKPGKLTEEEFDIIKSHTQIGYEILKAADEYSGLAEYALSHHERWDGKGYPKGLKGFEIPLFSRIICIADSFEAMTANRPYRKGLSLEEAIDEIKRCSGSQFDPIIAETFVSEVLALKLS